MTLIGFIAMTYISLASYQCILTTVGLISGIVIHKLLNSDHLNVSKFVAISGCTIGICLVLQPEFLYPVIGLSFKSNIAHQSDLIKYGNGIHLECEESTSESSMGHMTGYTLTVICGIMWSFTIACNRKLTSSPDFRQYYTSHMFWIFTFGLLMSSVLMLVSFQSINTLSQIYPHWNWNSKLNTKLRLELQVEYGFKLEFQVK